MNKDILMMIETGKDLEGEGEKQKLLPVARGVLEIAQLHEHTREPNLKERIKEESRTTWQITAPAILTSVAQFSIGFITVAYVGHLGEVELAAVSIVQNVIEGFVYGVMLGLGSAVETLCGQAVGAGELNMLGIYLQRSIIITLVTSFLLLPLYIFVSPTLKFLQQNEHISDVAGEYAVWVIPQLFAYALNFPIQKFLQAQSKIWVMTIISILVAAFHMLLNWILIARFGYGLTGAALAGNISWWMLVLAQLVYVVSGYFPESWTGLSSLAFKSLSGFVKLSLASAIMLCLELWYSTLVILLVGWLPNPKIAMDAMSICMNIQVWTLMTALGFNAAVSIRVSNELGAGNPEAAKLSIVVSVIMSTIFGLIFTAIIIGTKDYFARMFTSDPELTNETADLIYFLAVTVLINSVQPVLHGVAVGAGWQSLVAVINTVCYYLMGLPISVWLGFRMFSV